MKRLVVSSRPRVLPCCQPHEPCWMLRGCCGNTIAVEPQKLLKSLEGAVFEMALWVLLLPKTLLRVLRQPVWVLDYTTAELAKPEADRFDDSLSPMTFWLLVAVGPYLWATTMVRHRYSPPGEAAGDPVSHLPIINRYLIAALLLVAAPLTVAAIFSLIRGTA